MGIPARRLRKDRICDEARRTAGPVHLMQLFGLSKNTAKKYVMAAHPRQTTRPDRSLNVGPGRRGR
ncbi:hypothetical protein [Streptomyces sp. S.PNR 29]|uniref:hypothetical protein n=1 Tax=Streptomyces sp. S.PNR 29 TaxID=2973805 RepID=UPI0025B03654|nr:hypothetical protein [Streptomyces sp. S.PNR 29]MDN0199926.1 hypothetical protein [Streptomyces sp. S.PNR 29]